MRKNTLALITRISDGSMAGRVVDPSYDDGLAPEARIVWAHPTQDRSDPIFQDAESLKAAQRKFASGSSEVASVVVLADAHGLWVDGKAAVGTYEIAGMISAAEVQALMDKVKETAGGFGEDKDWPFKREKGEWLKTLSGYVDGSKACAKTILWPATWCEIEHQALSDQASMQPDEGLVFVDGDGSATLLAHRGGYLFWETESNGKSVDGMGIRPLPETEGIYYFHGLAWSDVSRTDWGDEHDAGLDVSEAVLATDELCAKFGRTLADCQAEVAEMCGEKLAERSEAPAP